ncbi:hypothetical protein ABVT39_009121 [Epinephelus coioides]
MVDYIADILDCSYTGKIDMEHKENILRSIGLHVMTKRMPMLQQLREGLDIYGFSQVMQAKTEECRSLFVAGDDESFVRARRDTNRFHSADIKPKKLLTLAAATSSSAFILCGGCGPKNAITEDLPRIQEEEVRGKAEFHLSEEESEEERTEKIQINTGIMCLQNDTMKAVRGKTLPLIVDPDTDAAGLHLLAVKKMTDFNTDLEEGPYVLIYPDSTEVNNIPGTLKPFTLRGYKAEIGKPYNRITVFICLRTDYDKKAVPKSFKEGTDNVRRHAAEHLKHATAKRTGGNINSSSLEPLHQGVLHLPV